MSAVDFTAERLMEFLHYGPATDVFRVASLHVTGTRPRYLTYHMCAMAGVAHKWRTRSTRRYGR